MSGFSELLTILTENGVRDEKSLEKLLRNLPENHNASSTAGGGYYTPPASPNLAPVAESICSILAGLWNGFSGGQGIQQFSLNPEERLEEENVKKALFLSQTSTIFTKHHFDYRDETVFTPEIAETAYVLSWTISHDFLRDVFRYREPLERGDLRLFPKSLAKTYRHTGWGGDPQVTTVSLLEQIARTNVYLDFDEELISAVIKRYKKDEQLILLPDLSVPWIADVGLTNILKLRDDYADSLTSFQRAYHQAVLAFIENHRSLDFARISSQINNDVIAPEVARIDRAYQKALSLHRNLSATQATVSVIPIIGVIVNSAMLGEMLSGAAAAMGLQAVASLVAAFATNRIQQSHALEALKDETFYVLWKVAKHGKA